MAVRSLSIAVIACIAGPSPSSAHAQAACSNSFKQWTQTSGVSIASAPAIDASFAPSGAPGRSRSYFVQGTQLFTLYNQNYPGGCVPVKGTGTLCAPNGMGNTCTRLAGCELATWSTMPASTLNNFPSPVPSSRDPSKEYIFLGADDGRVYRIDVSGEPPYTSVSADTKRPSCNTDHVVATPAVQLYAYANAAFQTDVDAHGGHATDDLVYAVTSTSCGDLTHNRVFAFWASTLDNPDPNVATRWIFNRATQVGQEAGPIQIGQGTEGCTIDYANNRLFCGTDAPTNSSQDTLWALGTIDGLLIWSDNPGGAMLNRPVLNPNNDTLYVVSRPGTLWAYNPAGNGIGGPLKRWAAGLSVAGPGAIVSKSPWVEPRAGTWMNKILVLDSLGTLYAVQDNGMSGTQLWARTPTDPAQWVSGPTVLPGNSESKAFLGRDDGYLQMVKLDGGQVQGIVDIASNLTQDVYDPTLDNDLVSGNAVVVVGGNKVSRVSVPICPDDPGA